MNAQLRRYLSEDWDLYEETTEPERENRATKRASAQTRRQPGTLWVQERGKAIAKHLRAIKQQRKTGKP